MTKKDLMKRLGKLLAEKKMLKTEFMISGKSECRSCKKYTFKDAIDALKCLETADQTIAGEHDKNQDGKQTRKKKI